MECFHRLVERIIVEFHFIVRFHSLYEQFKIGNITVTDNNDYIAYSSSDYTVTMDAIKNKLINTHGGYLQLRYESDGKYLDYLADFKTKSLQKVEYGRNITDIKISRDHTERVTALIPLGAKKSSEDEEGNETENEERVDITSVNGGKNYIYCTSNWDNVTAYYWSQANEHMIEWPGKQMESLGNKLFRIDVPADATKIIFSNNGQGQSADLDIPGFNQCFDEGGSKTWAPYNG